MIYISSFDLLPLWVLFIAMLGLALLVVEVGYHVGRWYASENDLDQYPMEKSANATVVGLLTFLLAFSFNSSAGHYGKVRSLLFKDRNLVMEIEQSARVLSQAEAAEVAGYIEEYASIRVNLLGRTDVEAFKQVVARSEMIQTRLLDVGIQARKETQDPTIAIYLNTVQALTKNHHELINRIFAERLPRIAWLTLSGLGGMGCLLFGFSCGLMGRRRYLPAVIIIIAFSSVVLLIIDLDRPVHTLATDIRETFQRQRDLPQ